MCTKVRYYNTSKQRIIKIKKENLDFSDFQEVKHNKVLAHFIEQKKALQKSLKNKKRFF